MKTFISCDWGTSALRLRLVDISTTAVLCEVSGQHGISNTFELWTRSGSAEDKRLSFYQSVLAEQIKELEKQSQNILDDVSIVISGMASSNIGMVELPYKELPFDIKHSDLNITSIGATEEFRHSTIVISGVKTEDDAMRGEETQLTGCINETESREQLFIFPGTHSKHVLVSNGSATDIKTYMTGEFFELLSVKSILSSSVLRRGSLADKKNKESFEAGVEEGMRSELLHSAFLVRTNYLFRKLSAEQNYYFLSGLLIGTELHELISNGDKEVVLVTSGELMQLYVAAFNVLDLSDKNIRLKVEDSGLALIKGQLKILQFG